MNKNYILLIIMLISVLLNSSRANDSDNYKQEILLLNTQKINKIDEIEDRYKRKQELITLNIEHMKEVTELKDKIESAQITKYVSIAISVTSGLVFAGGIKAKAFRKISTSKTIKKNAKKILKITTSAAGAISAGTAYIAYFSHQELKEFVDLLKVKEQLLLESNLLIENYE